MMMQQIALLAFAAIYQLVLVEASWQSMSCGVVNFPFCNRYYYDQINAFLVDNLKNEDVDESMKAILRRIQSNPSQTLKNKDAHQLRAWVELHQLTLIHGSGMCTPSSSRILEKNDQAVGEAISKLSPGEIPKRRIERLINHYATLFLQNCDHEVVVKNVTADNMRYVKQFVGGYITRRAREDLALAIFQPKVAQLDSYVEYSPHEACKFAKNLKGPGNPEITRGLLDDLATKNYDALKIYLNKVDLGNGVKDVDGNNVFEIYRKYVRKPCEEFNEKVESSFGSKWALKQSKKIHKRLNTEQPLYKNLAYYYGCTLLLHEEEKLLQELKNLIRREY